MSRAAERKATLSVKSGVCVFFFLANAAGEAVMVSDVPRTSAAIIRPLRANFFMYPPKWPTGRNPNGSGRIFRSRSCRNGRIRLVERDRKGGVWGECVSDRVDLGGAS